MSCDFFLTLSLYDTLQDWRTIYAPKGSNSNIAYLRTQIEMFSFVDKTFGLI
jgi:hypothetical protein